MKYLSLLQSAVYGDCKAFFLSLSAEQRKDALNFILTHQWSALILPSLSQILTEQERNDLQRQTQQITIRALVHEHGLKELCQLLESNRIRHCRIKGTDLAYRIYPNPAMRPFGDWDILFHPDDLSRAMEVLQQNGWEQTRPGLRQSANHHLSPVRKNHFTLEPHFTLANFTDVEPLDLWMEIHPAAPHSFHCILSPELNLLMQTRHAAGEYYRHESLHKLLLDTAFLMKKEHVDWDKVHLLANQWNLPYPDDVLGAWQEFFPKETLQAMSPNSENCRAIREIFSGTVKESSKSWKWIIQDNIFNIQWFRRRLIAFLPSRLRWKFHDQRTPYLILLFRDLTSKITFFLHHILHPDSAIRQHLASVHKIENSGKTRSE